MELVNYLETGGSSFWGSTINASVNDLIKICGNPLRKSGDSKVQYVWSLKNNEGIVFSIYDWKEYRDVSGDELIEWHIGGFNASDTNKIKLELETLLSKTT